jgi:hypothetical protein
VTPIATRPEVPVTETKAELPQPLSPRRRAEEWRDALLGGTRFEGLPLEERSGRLYLVYTVRPGDSFAAIASAYLLSAGPDLTDAEEVRRSAERFHQERYGRALWPGDEMLLAVPREVLDPSDAE